MEKSNRKAPVVFYIGLILLCVWLASFHLIGGLYARYSSFASGSDSARVAYVVAAANGDGPETGAINAADKNSAFYYYITVSNFEDQTRPSEVAMSYTIYIDLPENCPALSFSVLDKDGEVLHTEVSTQTEETQTIAFSDKTSMCLPAGVATIKEHTVMITGTENTADNYTGLIKIHVKAEQID